jgi:hypothetical protein
MIEPDPRDTSEYQAIAQTCAGPSPLLDMLRRDYP